MKTQKVQPYSIQKAHLCVLPATKLALQVPSFALLFPLSHGGDATSAVCTVQCDLADAENVM